ncbi:SH3 domain-containing protein [Acanthopleuribacter pedis]|uniref:SH3 domain-containing protein n=1 Tax=Acanthopleuribacter pedis TaxID=442870 RepID=A0A8J7QEP1_9BACT|nr:SH3 domain-containing protein [Acanthopleuribacter pedis]MBO1319406.1 SH3 domain-containing protein [Acanthopleuribacter pedis]
MPMEPIDLSHIVPQRRFLQSHPTPPDPKSSRYIDHTTHENADQSQNHRIVGFHLVLQKGHSNGLYELLHVDPKTGVQDPANPRVAVRELEIICDTLEIHDPLRLPETAVTLYARRLIWADDRAAVNTSPLPWTLDKARNAGEGRSGEDGAHGRHAGSLKLWVAQVVHPDGDTGRARLTAHGGPGQHGGEGLDGRDGVSRRAWATLTDTVYSPTKNSATVHFDPIAVKIDYEWTFIGIRGTTGLHTKGGDFPTSGTDALAPGKPGNGGDGGAVITNSRTLLGQIDVKPGKGGRPTRRYRGGSAGTPTRSAQYHAKLILNAFGTRDARTKVDTTGGPKTTTSGKDAPGQSAQKPSGENPAPRFMDQRNRWLHPLQLRRVLEVARDLFLGGARDQLQVFLTDYAAALAEDAPNDPAWNHAFGSHWTSSGTEVAVLLQHLRTNRDFFGNPAGFTPFLSLRGSIQLYEQALDRALHMLLLVRWVEQTKDGLQSQNAVLAETLGQVNDRIKQTAAEVVETETEISEIRAQLADLRIELEKKGEELVVLQNELLNEARGETQKRAFIRFGMKTAGALLQVIPVGQPVLGTVGSLANVTADLVGGDAESAPDTLSKIGKVFEKAHAAAQKAEGTRMKVKTFRDKFSERNAPSGEGVTEEEIARFVEQEPSRREKLLHQAGAGLGPAFSQFSGAVSALQVPEAEVEAELQRLSANSPEMQALSEEIRDLNQRKTTVLTKLMRALHKVGEGYADLSAAGLAAAQMQRARSENLVRLDLEAATAVREMGQRARNTLVYYLYLMVKAYESTVLTSIEVDWSLDKVTDKITNLLQGKQAFSAALLADYAEALKPIFQENLNRIRERLVDDFNFSENDMPLQFALSEAQTPRALARLNETGGLVVDPMALGLVLPHRQAARLSELVLSRLEFDPGGPSLPENHNLIISVSPDRHGTLRRGEALFAVFGEQPRSWGWSYLSAAAEGARIQEHTTSDAAEDMLQFILGDKKGVIRQKTALPPAWSPLTINLRFSPPLPQSRRPRVTRLIWTVKTSSIEAPKRQAVLQVQRLGLPGFAEIHCPPDLAGRGAGVNSFYRIFSKGSKVSLGAPEMNGAAAFDSWDLVGMRIERMGVGDLEVAFTMDDHVVAQSHWSSALAGNLTAEPSLAAFSLIAEEHTDPEVRATAARKAKRWRGPGRQRLRAAPSAEAPVIGMVPEGAAVEVLEQVEGGWNRVQWGALVGWIPS